MKQKIAALLLIAPFHAFGSSIGFELSRAEFPAFEFDRIPGSSNAQYSLDETGTFQLQLRGILEKAEFCTLSESSGCGIAALMVVTGYAGDASQIDGNVSKHGPVSAFGASATRVPVPGAFGLFVTGLLVLAAIRRKRPV